MKIIAERNIQLDDRELLKVIDSSTESRIKLGVFTFCVSAFNIQLRGLQKGCIQSWLSMYIYALEWKRKTYSWTQWVFCKKFSNFFKFVPQKYKKIIVNVESIYHTLKTYRNVKTLFKRLNVWKLTGQENLLFVKRLFSINLN